MTEISTYQRLHPHAYLEKFLAEDLRPDGRGVAEFRALQVTLGSISTAEGSALVRLGETTIVCGVKAEIAEPELDSPTHGFIVPNVEISAICSPKFKPGPPSEEAQVISEQIYQIINKCRMIDPESLCIQAGKAVWTIYVDAVCINFDGNAFDATLLAMCAALSNTRLPKATWNEDRQTTLCSRQDRASLNITKIPISATFGIFDSKHVLADPTSFEESLLDSTISVVLRGNDAISVSQHGPGATSSGDVSPVKRLAQCIEIAKERQRVVEEILSSSL